MISTPAPFLVIMQETQPFSTTEPPELEPGTPAPTGSRIISKVLSPAIQLWLRTQVEHLEECQFEIEGQDRQIVSGYIPGVSIFAQGAVYQGLHLSQVRLRGSNIRINLGQVVRGKALKLLEPIPVVGTLTLNQTDLNASLKTPLFGDAIAEFLLSQSLFVGCCPEGQSTQLHPSEMILKENQLVLKGSLVISENPPLPFVLETGLRLISPHQLLFEHPSLQGSPPLSQGKLTDFIWDLGEDVQLETLAVVPGTLTCEGQLLIRA